MKPALPAYRPSRTAAKLPRKRLRPICVIGQRDAIRRRRKGACSSYAQENFAIRSQRVLLWAATPYDGEFSTVRARYLEIERELEHEPRGERRVRLVNEYSG
jgi:hypothetical protein